jgi:hypothetical protein
MKKFEEKILNLINMFTLCITPYTKNNNNTLHYLSFIIFIHLVYLLKKSNGDKIQIKSLFSIVRILN